MLRVNTLLALFALIALGLCSSSVVNAQTATATLSGTVTDERDAVVPGATVRAFNTATGLQRETVTNSEGFFTIPLLPPSSYDLTVERQGFATADIKAVVINVGEHRAIQVRLQVGQIGETVAVEATSIIQTESAEIATTVDRQFVGNLPLNGRSFQSLIALAPGVVLTRATGGESGQFSVNGQRANANYFTVDGVSANVGASAGPLGQTGGGTLPGLSASGGTNNLVSVESLQEFRIQTSTYAPEFGRLPGGQVSIVTRSGTNGFHGSVFEYWRNDALDANDWFNNSRGLPKAPLRQHNFGGVFNGPLHLPRFGEGGPTYYSGENQTFFFFSYEGLRLRQPQTKITAMPSEATRNNAPVALQPFINAFPRPNGRDLGAGLAEFAATYSDPTTLNATSIRIDHKFNDNFTIFGRYNYAPSSTETRGLIQSLNNITRASFKTQTLTGGATWIINPSANNDLRINWSRNDGSAFLELDNFGGAVPPPDSLLFPVSASPADSLFTFLVLGPNVGYGVGTNVDNAQRQFNIVDSFLVIRGAHQLKFGADYRVLSPIFGSRESDLQAVFVGTTGLLSGRAASVSAIGREAFRFSFTNFSAYGQDTWKVSPKFTLTFGVRWELNPPPEGREGKELLTVNGLENLSTVALAPVGTPLWETTYTNFAPRLGIAYLLSNAPGRETVLRGGLGVFYDTAAGQISDSVVFAPYVRSRASANVVFPLENPALAIPPPFSLNPPFGTFFTADPNLKLPYTYQLNAAVERSLGTNQTISASYVGAIGRRLLRQDSLRNPNANFGTLRVTRNAATSDYHSMQLQFQRRLSRGLQALASYTWSHSIDSASNDSSVNAPLTLISIDQERGPSDFDVRHNFVAAVTYNLPKHRWGAVAEAILNNWSLDGIFRARTATAVNVIAGRDVIGSGVTAASRPDLIIGVPLYIDDPNVAGGQRINRLAFAIPVGRQGTLGRNALRGFPVSQVDLTFRRQFNVTENVNFQFRAEFFNLFNHPNFADPIGDLQNPLFGQSIQMLGRSLGSGGISGGFNPLYQIGGPRSIQLALKLEF